jgi:hypothetical protein
MANAPVHKTQSDLADAMGVNQSTISRRLADPDCPISASGPWDADDIDAMRDWLQDDDGDDVSRELKRSQALKAQTLSARYALQMMTEVGQVGSELFAEFHRALEQATLCHWRNTQHRLGDVFREQGGLPAIEADRFAEQFARQYCEGFADELARIFRFHNKLKDSLRPVIVHAEKVAHQLRQMGDLNKAILDQLDDEIDKAKAATGGDFT